MVGLSGTAWCAGREVCCGPVSVCHCISGVPLRHPFLLYHAGELIKTLEGHTDCVSAVAVGPDGKTIVSGSRDKTVRVWNSTTGVWWWGACVPRAGDRGNGSGSGVGPLVEGMGVWAGSWNTVGMSSFPCYAGEGMGLAHTGVLGGQR